MDFLARGEMPPGVTAADLEAMGLPKPAVGALAQEPATQQPTKPRSASAANAFACDSPDE